jgi:hypothetical protein
LEAEIKYKIRYESSGFFYLEANRSGSFRNGNSRFSQYLFLLINNLLFSIFGFVTPSAVEVHRLEKRILASIGAKK